MITTQDIFTKVETHLLNQNAKSLGVYDEYADGAICAYRGSNGKMCAVGCLISDDFYVIDLENEPADTEEVVYAVERSIGRTLTGIEASLLSKLQEVHDYDDPNVWKASLERVAEQFNLWVPKV